MHFWTSKLNWLNNLLKKEYWKKKLPSKKAILSMRSKLNWVISSSSLSRTNVSNFFWEDLLFLIFSPKLCIYKGRCRKLYTFASKHFTSSIILQTTFPRTFLELFSFTFYLSTFNNQRLKERMFEHVWHIQSSIPCALIKWSILPTFNLSGKLEWREYYAMLLFWRENYYSMLLFWFSMKITCHTVLDWQNF